MEERYRGKKDIMKRIGASWETILQMKEDGLRMAKIYGRWILYEDDLRTFEKAAIDTCQKACQ